MWFLVVLGLYALSYILVLLPAYTLVTQPHHVGKAKRSESLTGHTPNEKRIFQIVN